MDDTVLSSVPLTKRTVRRVALACIQCRIRKVRCDATQPACSRCRVDEKQCEYQKSRRGGRPRRPVAAQIQIAVDDRTTSGHYSEHFGSQTRSNSSTHGSSDSSTLSVCDSLEWKLSEATQPLLTSGARLSTIQVDQLLTHYYTYFHISHPCVLPRWSLEARLTTEPAISNFLLPVLLYIGSIFTHSIDSTPLANAAARTIQTGWTDHETPNAYFIQALMLYSIATYWCNEQEKGRQLLDEAISGAFKLGMHQKDFASRHGSGDPVLEESWRRTWWQIHVTDVHISGSTHSYQGSSVKYPITTELPCEEDEYEAGVRSYHSRSYITY